MVFKYSFYPPTLNSETLKGVSEVKIYILYQIRTDNVDAKDRSINHYTKRTSL